MYDRHPSTRVLQADTEFSTGDSHKGSGAQNGVVMAHEVMATVVYFITELIKPSME
jgi:hypothetical protein